MQTTDLVLTFSLSEAHAEAVMAAARELRLSVLTLRRYPNEPVQFEVRVSTAEQAYELGMRVGVAKVAP